MHAAARRFVERIEVPQPKAEQADILLFDNTVEEVYTRFHGRVRAFARNRCKRRFGVRIDVEDIVQSVFTALVQSDLLSKYQLRDEDTIWKVLSVMTLNELRSLGKYHHAKKRDVRSTHTLGHQDHQQFADRDELADLVIADLLQTLPKTDQIIAIQRLHGYEVGEIAERMKLAKRTVERSLHQTRNSLACALQS